MKQNKFNSISAIILLIFITLGCNFLQESSENNSVVTGNKGTGETGKLDTDDIEIKLEDESSGAVNDINSTDGEEEDQNGNKTITVKFAKGKTSRSYSDAVVRATSNTYVLGASKGQNMSVSISSTEDNAVFRVVTPGGQTVAGTEENGIKNFNETLPKSGNYKIVVTPTRGNATYKINFAVSAKEQQPETEETSGGLTTIVKFRKGGTSASYENAVIRGERNTYILGAGGGQTMNVSISSIENNAVFDVVAPNGRTLTSEKTNWSGQLPSDGKYRIVVGGTRGNATYRINFAVR